MKKLEREIADLIREIEGKTGRHIMIGTVESATGGRIADKITNVPGSADYFKGTLVAYSNEMKIRVVGVREQTIEEHGAVSDETAVEMAGGGRKLMQLDICVSTTGIAGPTGATPTKPLGLFHIGLSTHESSTSRQFRFTGRREAVKEKAAREALRMLKDLLHSMSTSLDSAGLKEKRVVTCFLEQENMILILRRSSRATTYRRAWAGVSGYVESDDPLDQAYTEIREETGLYRNAVKLISSGEPIEILDRELNTKWIVHPFLFHVSDPDKIRLNWENTEFKWVKPGDLARMATVPGLSTTLRKVLH
jgi:nicotinamide-nucleotide amidase